MLEDKKIQLYDVLVKAASWLQSTSINKVRYSSFQLATGKAVINHGLTTVNVATENMTDDEAVKKIMETLTKTIAEFRETIMRKN